MLVEECCESKNFQGCSFFPVFSKAIYRTNYKTESLKSSGCWKSCKVKSEVQHFSKVTRICNFGDRL